MMDSVSADIERHLDWITLTEALEAGHRLPRAQITDSFLTRGDDTLLTRCALIDGLGMAVKTATVFGGNPAKGLPRVNGMMTLFSDANGMPEAMVDFTLVTKWKTAGDSLLAARKLARPDAKRVLILGAGHVAASMVAAYRAGFPGCEITIWNRTPAAAEALAKQVGAQAVTDLGDAVSHAEIIATTTMASTPILRGEWLSAGTHVDLIGAFRADLREADDTALQRARLFVDSRATTIHHIGELKIPIASGAIREADILGDFYDIASGQFARKTPEEITICKNGGGAHLDLITAQYIWQTARAQN